MMREISLRGEVRPEFSFAFGQVSVLRLIDPLCFLFQRRSFATEVDDEIFIFVRGGFRASRAVPGSASTMVWGSSTFCFQQILTSFDGEPIRRAVVHLPPVGVGQGDQGGVKIGDDLPNGLNHRVARIGQIGLVNVPYGA